MTALSLDHIADLLKQGKSQDVIDLLPEHYPAEFNSDCEDLLKVAVLAAKTGSTAVIAHFLTQYAQNPTGQFAFHDVARAALSKNHPDIVRLLVPHWFRREITAGQSLVGYAINTQNADTVRLALSFTDQFRPAPLLLFGVLQNDLGLVDHAIEQGANPAEDHHKALASALAIGNRQMSEKLWPYLEKEENALVRKRTALIMAVACITNDDAIGFLRRAVDLSEDDFENFRMSSPLQELKTAP